MRNMAAKEGREGGGMRARWAALLLAQMPARLRSHGLPRTRLLWAFTCFPPSCPAPPRPAEPPPARALPRHPTSLSALLRPRRSPSIHYSPRYCTFRAQPPPARPRFSRSTSAVSLAPASSLPTGYVRCRSPSLIIQANTRPPPSPGHMHAPLRLHKQPALASVSPHSTPDGAPLGFPIIPVRCVGMHLFPDPQA